MKSGNWTFNVKALGLIVALVVAAADITHAQLSDAGGSKSIHSLKEKKEKPTPPWFVQRFTLSAGLFMPINNTSIKVGTTDGSIGTNIDLEDDLGFKSSTQSFYADLQWRASRRSRFDITYYSLHRSADKTLQKEIDFKDNVYPISASVNAHFNTDIVRFSYGYAIITNPKYEVGLLIGAHIMKTGVGISANTGAGSASYSDEFNFTAPLPDLGVWGGYAFAKNWSINAEFGWLSLSVDNIYGRILGGTLGINYSPVKNLRLCLAYTGLNIKADVERDNWKGDLKWNYNGPVLTVGYSFGNYSWK
ncbi:hypothetical protein [Taibaiella soli]|uniref:Outer membrane protein beta-barrel domain-containing protein n=1 Tax=Taibaiella soli TaxID=1649169 RepID=A0A2W2C2D9_9BACT|nr:hypothetical protein [Taibaiella soli]PZF74253.1 hypothetical protein DN068_04360 [Taibaiella soli]